MSSWVTHLMIADSILKKVPLLDRRGFCVGNIAPDCNQENEDFTAFIPPRTVTHWMHGRHKTFEDAESFFKERIVPASAAPISECGSFLLGYYAHLVTDAAHQEMIRSPERVRAVWQRIHADEALHAAAAHLPENWDSVKALIPTSERRLDIQSLEADYLIAHPDSGYITDILPLKSFPDYLDILPPGGIVRKIGVMGVRPVPCRASFIALSRDEYSAFVQDTVQRLLCRIAPLISA